MLSGNTFAKELIGAALHNLHSVQMKYDKETEEGKIILLFKKIPGYQPGKIIYLVFRLSNRSKMRLQGLQVPGRTVWETIRWVCD